jgi:hypothetical protein
VIVQGFEELPDEGGDRGTQLGCPNTRTEVGFVVDGNRDVFHGTPIRRGGITRRFSIWDCAPRVGNYLQTTGGGAGGLRQSGGTPKSQKQELWHPGSVCPKLGYPPPGNITSVELATVNEAAYFDGLSCPSMKEGRLFELVPKAS